MSGLVDLIKGNKVRLCKVQNGDLHYCVQQARINPNCRSSFDYYTTDDSFVFVVPKEDLADATFLIHDKAELFIKWIKKAMEDT